MNNMKFHNPYHFVPVESETDKSRWKAAEQYKDRKGYPYLGGGHSRYRKAAYHGQITCTLTTETPVFIGGQRYEAASDQHPARVAPYELDGQPTIPATTLRGMISSVAEAASHSAMRVLAVDTHMSYRKTPARALKGVGQVVESGDDFFIKPLSQTQGNKFKLRTADTVRLDQEEITLKQLANKEGTAMERYYYRDDHFPGRGIPNFFTENGPGRIRGKFRVMDASRRGFPNAGKHRDFFIDIPESEEKLQLPPNVIGRFHALVDSIDETQNKSDTEEYMLLPYHPLGTRRNLDRNGLGHKLRIKDGDLVFYRQQGGQVTEISFSAIWRDGPRKEDGDLAALQDFFDDEEVLPFHHNRHLLSPAERVFGFVEERPTKEEKEDEGKEEKGKDTPATAYAGHMRFGEACWDGSLPKDADSPYMDEVTLKILDSPKPPSPALYFRPKTGSNEHKEGYIEKQRLNPGDHCPQGRKFYIHHRKQDIDKDRHCGSAARELWETCWDESTNYKNLEEREKKGRLKQKTRITPLREGLKFTFCVDFDNLDDYELGMLLYALCPNKEFRHKIGMGKPLGLGTVMLTIESVETIDRRTRYCKQDPFSDERYHERYKERDWIKFRDKFREEAVKISKAAVEALERLGNPANVTRPVHYPQVGSVNDNQLTVPEMELENYRWWVANDNPGRHAHPPPNGGQSLKPLDKTDATDLPVLERLRSKK